MRVSFSSFCSAWSKRASVTDIPLPLTWSCTVAPSMSLRVAPMLSRQPGRRPWPATDRDGRQRPREAHGADGAGAAAAQRPRAVGQRGAGRVDVVDQPRARPARDRARPGREGARRLARPGGRARARAGRRPRAPARAARRPARPHRRPSSRAIRRLWLKPRARIRRGPERHRHEHGPGGRRRDRPRRSRRPAPPRATRRRPSLSAATSAGAGPA